VNASADPGTGSGPHPQEDLVAYVLGRAADAEEVAHAGGAGAPPLAAVRTHARRVRARRRAGVVVAVTAAAAAVTVIVGVSVLRPPTVVHPARDADPPAGRFLRPADLGTGGWSVMRAVDGAADVALTAVPMDGCANPAHAFAPNDAKVTDGRSRSYRGQTPEGVTWTLVERIGRVAQTDRTNLLAQIRAMATCKDTSVQVLLAAASDVVVWGTPRTATTAGPIGPATAYALAGDTLVSLDTVPGSIDSGPALPGQARWLLDTLDAAVRRATGTTTTLPPLTPAARTAAQHYRQLDPGHASGGDPDPLRGLLRPADLDAVGSAAGFAADGWSLTDMQTATPFQAQLPVCLGRSQTLLYGRGTSSTLTRQQAHGRPHEVNQLRMSIDATSASTARQALTAVSNCPGAQLDTIAGQATSTIDSPTRVLAWQPAGDGTRLVAEAWILHNTQLVQLSANLEGLTTAEGSANSLPTAKEWFLQVVKRAESTMDG